MRKPLGILWAIVLLSITITAYSQDTTSVKARPKVGLVLSGGGAKGAAHIGVLKYIEEAEIPIDYIAGTSMGAIVGGMYAMGYSAFSEDRRAGTSIQNIQEFTAYRNCVRR